MHCSIIKKKNKGHVQLYYTFACQYFVFKILKYSLGFFDLRLESLFFISVLCLTLACFNFFLYIFFLFIQVSFVNLTPIFLYNLFFFSQILSSIFTFICEPWIFVYKTCFLKFICMNWCLSKCNFCTS